MDNTWLEIERIDVNIKDLAAEFAGCKIAHLSDVHLPYKKSAEVIKITARERPDIIVMTGDIVNNYQQIDTCGLADFCRQISNIAPAYIITGNHESRSETEHVYLETAEKNGCIPLSDSFDIIKNGSGRLAIMGADDRKTFEPEHFRDERLKSATKLLLCHRPHPLKMYNQLKEDIRPHLVFSGHAHGGQIRLPGIGGLLAPDQGLFPRLTSGLYEKDNIKMIVSRGVGDSTFPFRLWNKPHIPIITLEEEHHVTEE